MCVCMCECMCECMCVAFNLACVGYLTWQAGKVTKGSARSHVCVWTGVHACEQASNSAYAKIRSFENFQSDAQQHDTAHTGGMVYLWLKCRVEIKSNSPVFDVVEVFVALVDS
jgi:hypothetical protein